MKQKTIVPSSPARPCALQPQPRERAANLSDLGVIMDNAPLTGAEFQFKSGGPTL